MQESEFTGCANKVQGTAQNRVENPPEPEREFALRNTENIAFQPGLFARHRIRPPSENAAILQD
jgi:hypothetical protein